MKANDFVNLSKEFKSYKEKAAKEQRTLNEELALKNETINSLSTKAEQKCQSD